MMGMMKPLKRSVAVWSGGPAARSSSSAGRMTRMTRSRVPGDCRRSPCLTARTSGPRSSGPGGSSSGWNSRPAPRIGEKTADRGGYRLRLADYAATILAGVPAVPQPDDSMTQYTACRYTGDPGTLAEAAARGSLCAQVFLEDNSKKRLAAGEPS